jgi:hypothetical protein
MAIQFPYYIWQNPSALARIYPNRIAKLREFLLVYQEADLMAQHANLVKAERQAKVRQELSAYEQELLALGDDQQALLAKVLEYLEHSGRDFKPWVKYIVVHFSGMRYASAHGSWAEPRELLKILLKRKLITSALMGGNPAESLTDEQALAVLEELGPNGSAPAPSWAWPLIVLYTPLRTIYITPTNAFLLDPGGQNNIQGYSEALQRGDPYILALLEWLKPALTSWRERHYQDFSLVVLRAMCNEVSEHVHHIRLLNRAGGGLNARPGWYFNFEKTGDPQAPLNVSVKKKPSEGKQKHPLPNDYSNELLPDLPAGGGAYLRRPKNETFFKPGASILWLGWVKAQPSEWQMTFPLRGYYFYRADPSDQTWEYGTRTVPITVGSRATVIRSQGVDKEKKKKKKEGEKPQPAPVEKVEWLRWTHEAIVLDVVDLLSGRTVLTFETEPVTGLNRRPLGSLCNPASDQPLWHVFVGYAGDRALDPPHQGFLDFMTNEQFITEAEPAPPGPEAMFAPPETVAVAAHNVQLEYDRLTPRQRKAVALYCQGFSLKQAGRRMGIPPAKVDEILHAAAEQVSLANPQALALYFNGIDFGKWNVLKESSY